jgi:hypothetical protein
LAFGALVPRYGKFESISLHRGVNLSVNPFPVLIEPAEESVEFALQAPMPLLSWRLA